MLAKELAKLLMENPELEVVVHNTIDSGYDKVFGVDEQNVVPTLNKKNWQGDYQDTFSDDDMERKKIVFLIS